MKRSFIIGVMGAIVFFLSFWSLEYNIIIETDCKQFESDEKCNEVKNAYLIQSTGMYLALSPIPFFTLWNLIPDKPKRQSFRKDAKT